MNYAERLVANYGASVVYPLVDIASGAAITSVPAGYEGTQSGWSLQSVPGPIPGEMSPVSDGASSIGNVFTSALASVFNQSEGSVSICVRMGDAYYDSRDNRFFHLFADGTNLVFLQKNTVNQLGWRYTADGTTDQGSSLYANQGWMQLTLVYSKSDDSVQMYLNGALINSQSPATLGAWVGNLTIALVGASAANTRVLDGALAYVAYWGGTTLTLTDVQGMWNDLAQPVTVAETATIIATDSLTSNNSNGATFRENAIYSVVIGSTTYQAIAYWDDNQYARIGVRVLDGAWTWYAYDGTNPSLPTLQQTVDDFHYVINIGIDVNGYLHIVYDTRTSAMKYRRSTLPLNTFNGQLSAELSMLGTNESAMTYPTFFTDPAGTLYYMFRDGDSGDGDLYFYVYNAGTETWGAATGTTAGLLIDGKNSTPDQNAYWGQPAFDNDFGAGGYMHFGFIWRETISSLANHDVSYVRWDGANWEQSDGSAQTVPITLANCDIIDAVAKSSGLTSQLSIDADSYGNPHLAYIKNDVDSNSRFFHTWHNGTSWVKTGVGPHIVGTFVGLANPVLSPPRIAVRRSDNTVFIVGYNNSDDFGLLAYRSSDDTTWTTEKLYSFDVQLWNPSWDPIQWRSQSKFYLPISVALPYPSAENGKLKLVEYEPS
jgi:hypothetical protein